MKQTSRIIRVGRWRRVLSAAIVAGVLALGVGGTAVALPPDGAGPDTPGTSSRVWPTTVEPGGVLNFEVSGFPANEIVYIKIDDGNMCADTSHGACVYATQKLDGNGYASGSIVVPENLTPGGHWLRMLGTGDVFDERSGEKLGYEGYTRRGGNDFTVVAPSTDSGSSTGGSSGGQQTGQTGGQSTGGQGTDSTGGSQQGGTTNSDGTIEGGTITVEEEAATEESPAPSTEPKPAPAPANDDGRGETAGEEATETLTTEEPAQDSGSDLPIVGIAALGGAVVLGGGGLTAALIRRNKLVKAAAAQSSGDGAKTP